MLIYGINFYRIGSDHFISPELYKNKKQALGVAYERAINSFSPQCDIEVENDHVVRIYEDGKQIANYRIIGFTVV